MDQEAAVAQGISVRQIFALSWAVAGAVAVVGGMMLAGGAGPAPGLSVSLSLIALRAFPAIILGGLDSPAGAVVGGLTIGVAQVMAGGYVPSAVPALGAEFADVVPYLIMLVVLLVRPYGLFGTARWRGSERWLEPTVRWSATTETICGCSPPGRSERCCSGWCCSTCWCRSWSASCGPTCSPSPESPPSVPSASNLLTGYTGQPSLGHAAFIGLGAFIAAYLGGGRLLSTPPAGYDLNLWVYLLVAMVAGGIVGLVVGLPALRLRGNYLVIVTLGLVYLAIYLWQKWTTFTGGNAGTSMPIKADVYNIAGHKLDLLGNFTVFGKTLGPKEGLMYLAWGLVAVVAIVVKNIVRSRPGRALQAVRDRDVAAEVIGVSLFRYKISVFVISSAIAALAGRSTGSTSAT